MCADSLLQNLSRVWVEVESSAGSKAPHSINLFRIFMIPVGPNGEEEMKITFLSFRQHGVGPARIFFAAESLNKRRRQPVINYENFS